MNASWVSLKPGSEFYDEAKTRSELKAFFSDETEDTEMEGQDSTASGVPEAITSMLDKPLAIEALGGMMFYLRSLNMANDLLSQRSFNVYDPIRKGENLVLDGQTLSHLEVSLHRRLPKSVVDHTSTDSRQQRRRRRGNLVGALATMHHSIRKAAIQDLAYGTFTKD